MIVKFKWFVDGQQYVRSFRIKKLEDALEIPHLKERGAIEVWEVQGQNYWLVRSRFNVCLAVIYKE